ncbi:MAG: toll/interleukin-1 receptor domain-containing protein [Clostridia bacterium]|nr:toll/interleukin-1 receptor domain-containing protein [Clostridia bacterium]
MAFFKCKMCGGTLELDGDGKTGICDSCGTQQTVPRLDDDRRVNLYDRANHLRRNCEFDKASALFEQLLNETPDDAEAYWSLVLCKYGVEYVEDPKTGKRLPTIHRTQYTSVLDDDNYKQAINYADASQRGLYEEEARRINGILKDILTISQKEEDFDVFISYKDKDSSGKRTRDSVFANDIYHQLTAEGFKVFFSAITLEDKLGEKYEPYIFAALNSAVVMVVLGSRPEYFNAVWVKNEWSRYLSLVKESGGQKVLIPAFIDMDPYDLPEEFSHLQAQDMSKIGFMPDLIRGVKKIVEKVRPKQAPLREIPAGVAPVMSGGAPAIDNMVKRVFNEIRGGEFGEAKEILNDVLNRDPDNAEALLAQVMIKERIRDKAGIPALGKDLMSNYSFKLAYDNASGSFKEELKDLVKASNMTRARKIAADADNREDVKEITALYDDAIRIYDDLGSFQNAQDKKNELIEKKHTRLYEKADELYMQASRHMDSSKAPEWFKTSASVFEKLAEDNYRDAAIRFDGAQKMSEACEKDSLYKHADLLSQRRDITSQTSAAEEFTRLGFWRDSNERAAQCRITIEAIQKEIKRKQEIYDCEAEMRAVSERRSALLQEINDSESIRKKSRANNILRVVTLLAALICLVVGVYAANNGIDSVSTRNMIMGIIMLAVVCPIGFTEIKRSKGSIIVGIIFIPYLLFFAIKGFFKLFIPLKSWERSSLKRAENAKYEIASCEAKLRELNARYRNLSGT